MKSVVVRSAREVNEIIDDVVVVTLFAFDLLYARHGTAVIPKKFPSLTMKRKSRHISGQSAENTVSNE